jgi:hypothetical protein
MQWTRKSHILKWLLSYTPRTKKETVMGTLAFYELLDESAYIAVFLVTSHNTVWRGKFLVKFIYSKMATKFCEISPFLLTGTT